MMNICVDRSRPARFVAAALSILVVLVGVGISAVPARAAETLSVGADQAYPTVQSAVTAAAPGDTIVIAPGTYVESVVIDKPLTLLGANQGVAGTGTRSAESIIVAASSTSSAIQASRPVNVDGVQLQQAAITTSNTNSAMSLTAGAENSSLRNSVVTQTRIGVAIALDASSGATTIEDNLFSGWTGFAVRSVTSHGLNIMRNTIEVASTGAEAASAGLLLYETNVNPNIEANAIKAKTGISFDARGALPSTGARFTGNVINLNQAQTAGRGITLAKRNISDVKFSKNVIGSDGLNLNTNGIEASIAGLATADLLKQVEITENTIADVRTGLGFPGLVTDVNVEGNSINASDRLVSFAGGATNAKVLGNTLLRADTLAGYGIIAQGPFTNALIDSNTVLADYALYMSPQVANVTFSNNDVTSMRGVRSAAPSTALTITDNLFKTTGTSISLAGNQTDLVITGNQINGGIDGMAFSVRAGEAGLINSKIEGNSIAGVTGASVSGIQAGAGAESVTAPNNYWSRKNSLYPSSIYTTLVSPGALPVDPLTGADNAPTTVPEATGATEVDAVVANGTLSVDLGGVSLLGVVGAANGDVYPHTVDKGEWIKIYFAQSEVWSEWLQAPAGGKIEIAAPDGTASGESAQFVNFAGDVFAQVPVDKFVVAPVLVTEELTAGVVGSSYSQQLEASGTAPLSFAVTGGALPAGLKLSAAGVVSGTPTKKGSFSVTVSVSNAAGAVSREYLVSVTEAPVVDPPKGPVCTPARKSPVFADVALTQKFYTEIDWMHCMKLSTGTRQPPAKPLYKPMDKLSREAMAAFMFRLEAPKKYTAPKVSPFADVKPGDAFYTQIAWMWEAKLSTGTAQASGKPLFKPKESLSREAMAAFIYRLESPKKYTAPKVSPMADMKPGMKFYKEISWMYSAKLTTGNKVGTTKEYWPKDKLSREAMAAFIYRLVTDYRK